MARPSSTQAVGGSAVPGKRCSSERNRLPWLRRQAEGHVRPFPAPPPPFSSLPAPWAGGVVPFSGRGWESLFTLPSAQRRCAEADGCPTVQGRGGGKSGEASASCWSVSPTSRGPERCSRGAREPARAAGAVRPVPLGPGARERRHEHVLRLQGEGGGGALQPPLRTGRVGSGGPPGFPPALPRRRGWPEASYRGRRAQSAGCSPCKPRRDGGGGFELSGRYRAPP